MLAFNLKFIFTGGIALKKCPVITKLILLLILVLCIALPVQAVFSAYTNVDKVNMFSEPTPSATVVEVLKIGDIVKVLDKSEDGEFWRVEHKGHYGWIKSYQLSPKDHRY